MMKEGSLFNYGKKEISQVTVFSPLHDEFLYNVNCKELNFKFISTNLESFAIKYFVEDTNPVFGHKNDKLHITGANNLTSLHFKGSDYNSNINKITIKNFHQVKDFYFTYFHNLSSIDIYFSNEQKHKPNIHLSEMLKEVQINLFVSNENKTAESLVSVIKDKSTKNYQIKVSDQ